MFDTRPCYVPPPERVKISWWIVNSITALLAIAPGIALYVWG